jgi:hypothetical protein
MAEKSRAEELHDEYRKKLWDDIKSGTENFDKYMLTFSSGALGLSLAFIKDVVPISRAIWIASLIASWIAFVICILVTLISFRISIRALENMGPALDAFYLEGKPEAFNKHLGSFWTRAVDWSAYSAISSFILGLAFTMMFVGANIREAKRMNANEISAKETPTAKSMDFGCKPAAMTPLEKGIKPAAMTPVARADDRGAKPPAMTPVQPAQPTPAPAPTQSGQSKK